MSLRLNVSHKLESSLTRGPERGSYYHVYLLRGRPDLCQQIKRTRIKKTARPARPPRPPVLQPDFSKYEICRELNETDLTELHELGKKMREDQEKERAVDEKMFQSIQPDTFIFPNSPTHLQLDSLPTAGRNQPPSLQSLLWEPLQSDERPVLSISAPARLQLSRTQPAYNSGLELPISAPESRLSLFQTSSTKDDSLEPRPLPHNEPVSTFALPFRNSYIIGQRDIPISSDTIRSQLGTTIQHLHANTGSFQQSQQQRVDSLLGLPNSLLDQSNASEEEGKFGMHWF